MANAESVASQNVPLHEEAVLVMNASRLTNELLSYEVRVDPSTTSQPTANVDVESKIKASSLVLNAAAT